MLSPSTKVIIDPYSTSYKKLKNICAVSQFTVYGDTHDCLYHSYIVSTVHRIRAATRHQKDGHGG